MGSVIMSNSNNAQNTPKTYDAADMYDLASLAECDMQWMNVAIADIKKRIKELKKDLGINATGFYALDNILDMYQYLADTRLNYHMGEAERLEKELEQLKGGRNA